MYIHQKNEQGSPDPLPSQMVPPSPLWPGGSQQQQQSYIGSVRAAVSS